MLNVLEILLAFFPVHTCIRIRQGVVHGLVPTAIAVVLRAESLWNHKSQSRETPIQDKELIQDKEFHC